MTDPTTAAPAKPAVLYDGEIVATPEAIMIQATDANGVPLVLNVSKLAGGHQPKIGDRVMIYRPTRQHIMPGPAGAMRPKGREDEDVA